MPLGLRGSRAGQGLLPTSGNYGLPEGQRERSLDYIRGMNLCLWRILSGLSVQQQRSPGARIPWIAPRGAPTARWAEGAEAQGAHTRPSWLHPGWAWLSCPRRLSAFLAPGGESVLEPRTRKLRPGNMNPLCPRSPGSKL